MRQITQNLRTGSTNLEEIPSPLVQPGHVLIRTSCSLVSLGTERMLVEFGKANFIDKARQQPEKVQQVLEKVRSEGLLPTIEAVFNKLDQPIPLGYCNAGTVIAVGTGVTDIKIGDRVASNGPHAEFVCVPVNLVALVPEGVSDEEAAFTPLASIGLQGIRLLETTMGETIVVFGLGIIGLISAELLLANGCKVIGLDVDEEKLKLAESKGIITVRVTPERDPVSEILALTGGIGADGVLITASARDNSIVSQAARMSRKRGRIILVGVTGLQLNRSEFYEKELRFQVSCSYGPGRYDPQYEQKGIDYPLPFVRWTEKRNFEVVLWNMSRGTLDVRSLISERVPLEEYERIYGDMRKSGTIASLITYSSESIYGTSIKIQSQKYPSTKGIAGIIGAGNFTRMTLLPALQKSGLAVSHIASAKGLSGTSLARKFGIPHSTTDYRDILNSPDVDLVIITTRHNQHATQVIESLQAGKHVFVEKPLTTTLSDLESIVDFQKTIGVSNTTSLTVGYNRRFAPTVQKMAEITRGTIMNVTATMNAGFIPADSWVHDADVGGGRIIGEACHLIDLITFLTQSHVVSVCMMAMGKNPSANTDNASIMLRYANGSTGVVHYFANGSKSYAKERIEVFTEGKTLILDNFMRLDAFGVKGFSSMKTRLDKGHKNQFLLLSKRLKEGGEPIIPFSDLINTSKASFAAIESLQAKSWVDIS